MPYQAIGPQRSAAGIDPKVMEQEEAATQTFKAGAPLLRNAAGFIEECATNFALAIGIAAKDGANTATAGLKKSLFYRIRQGVEFDGVLKTAALTQTMLGETYGLVKGADGIWYVDTANTTGNQVNIADRPSRVKIGAVDPVLEFTFDAANIQEP